MEGVSLAVREFVGTGVGSESSLGKPMLALLISVVSDVGGDRVREAGGDEVGPAPLPPMREIQPVTMNRFVTVVWRECHFVR
jgi:hypothetical protein